MISWSCWTGSFEAIEMFTGIVREVGRIRELVPLENGVRIVVAAKSVLPGLELGDSVALDGVCQTVVELDPAGFSVVAIGTTLSRTTLGSFQVGDRVNLEAALALGAPLGGHLVQGHIDGVGEVVAVERDGEHRLIDFKLPEIVAEVTVLHGSITVNGVSLTINALPEPDMAQVAIIPYTWEETTLSELRPGDLVNLEGDLLGKFVVNYLKRMGSRGKAVPTEE
jgi:riboflavin synthase